MKRPPLSVLAMGLIAGGIVMGLHASGLLGWPERTITHLVSGQTAAPEAKSNWWQFVLVFALASGVAWMSLVTTRRSRLGWLIAILLVELVGVAWVCSLFQVLFQPLPSILAAALGFFMPIAFFEVSDFVQRRRDLEPASSPEKVSIKPAAPVKRAEVASDSRVQVCEITAVVCDIANKHDLAEESESAAFVEITERFLAQASDAFRKAGAYIESASGEGVVAIFGYPDSDKQHAEKATRTAMALIKTFSDKAGKVEAPATVGVQAGISSGTMIMAPVKNNGQRSLLAMGEPVELARRFCIANRFYGSRVLLGPRTFELASKILVARPIDFLSGVDARERHEIYEPVALALDATRDQITRRDAFWNGVVLYREKRWAEAYSQFQNARDPGGEEDRPLQLYLRRIEPLALQLVTTPLEE